MTLVEQIFDALAKVQDPELRKPITDLGMVEDLQPKDLNPKTFMKKQVADLLDEGSPKPKVNRPKAMIDPDLL